MKNLALLVLFLIPIRILYSQGEILQENIDKKSRLSLIFKNGLAFGCSDCIENDGGIWNYSIGETVKASRRPLYSNYFGFEYSINKKWDVGIGFGLTNLLNISAFKYQMFGSTPNSNFSILSSGVKKALVLAVPVSINYRIKVSDNFSCLATGSLGVDYSQPRALFSHKSSQNGIFAADSTPYQIYDRVELRFKVKNYISPFAGFGFHLEHNIGVNAIRFGIDYHFPFFISYGIETEAEHIKTRENLAMLNTSKYANVRGDYFRVSLTLVKGFKK
jgi:hypothetical protein